MNGLIGKKIGMTQLWDETGNRVSVTVLAAGPCPVVQVKTPDKDGYAAAQLGYGPRREKNLTKSLFARYKAAGVSPRHVLREFAIDGEEEAKVGEEVSVALFKDTGWVDVTGLTKGRGFAGVVRRHGMHGGPMTHGGQAKRRPGAVGHATTPARVQKNKKMPGHMGANRVTSRNLAVVEVREEENILLVKGAVPGPNGAYVIIRKALKKG